MPILPKEEPPHHHRQAAESFGEDAERYDRSRPRYPRAMIGRIAATGPRVLDVGTGTGISARQLQTAGCTVLGVEPDERMAALARGYGVETEIATFEQWDPKGRTFDTVTAGQAWHWVDPAAGAVKAAQVLRPGGRVALFWYVGDPEPAVAAAFADVYARHAADLPVIPSGQSAIELYSTHMFPSAAQGLTRSGAFSEPEQWRYDWQHVYTRDAWLDQVPTHGTHTRLPAPVLTRILDGLGAAIDAAGGTFVMNYAAVTVTATRTGTPEPPSAGSRLG